MDDSSIYGFDYEVFLNNKKINNLSFDFNDLKKNDVISIFYKDSNVFNLYQHLLIHEIDNIHDDDYFLRKELEK